MSTSDNVMKIRAIMDYYCLNQTEMAAKIGIHQTNLSEMLRGKRACGDGIIAKLIITMPELNTNWLLYGEGEMLKPSASVVQHNRHGNNNYVVGSSNMVQCSNCGGDVPVLIPDDIQGAPIIPTALSRQPNVDILEYLNSRTAGVERSNVQAAGIAIDVWHRVRDNSLSPDYLMGDMLALWSYPQGQENPIPGKLYAVDTYSNGLVVRKLFPADGGDYRACAINTGEFPEFVINRSDIIRIYRVMLMMRI